MHRQIAATALATTVDRIVLQQSDTAHGGHDTGAYGSAGTFVAGRATQAAAEELARCNQGICRGARRADAGVMRAGQRCGRSAASSACAFAELDDIGAARRDKTLEASGTSAGTPRSVAFNVQGFRVAVNKGTGEIRILKSVQAADAGRVANPMQCRGQIEGGVAQALGAALYEEMVIDDGGPRDQSDIPRLPPALLRRRAAHRGVFRRDLAIRSGPMGAKSMSESPYNPVAAALGNAHRRRHRHPLHADAVQARPAVAGVAGEVRKLGVPARPRWPTGPTQDRGRLRGDFALEAIKLTSVSETVTFVI